MNTIIRIPDKQLKTDPAYAEWKERAEQGRACDYQQPFFTNTEYIDICVGAPVVRWEGPAGGRVFRTAYCAECARSESPSLTWTSPVVLTVLPGCPDGVRAWAEARERVIASRVEGTSGADWRRALVEAFEVWIDERLDQDRSDTSLWGIHDDPEAFELAIADGIAERRRLRDRAGALGTDQQSGRPRSM